jgi:hypothetical protein
MRFLLPLLFVPNVLAWAGGREPIRGYKPEIEPYVHFLAGQRKDPVDYVMGLFDRYDVVVLAEGLHPELTQWEFIHKLTMDPRFVERVGHVFTEYFSVSQQADLDAFLASGRLDEGRLLKIFRDFPVGPQGWLNNNFYEYLKKLHALNRGLPADRRVRLFFCDIPWRWEGMTKEEYKRLESILDLRDYLMASRISAEFQEIKQHERRRKALVVMNTRHAFGAVRTTTGTWADNTATYLARWLPGQVAHVMINFIARDFGEVKDGKMSLIQGGKWDAAFSALGEQPVGFDFVDSPFGKDRFDYLLPAYGHLTYQEVFTGMVFWRPLREHVRLELIPGLLDENFTKEMVRRMRMTQDLSDEDAARIKEAYAAYYTEVYPAMATDPGAKDFQPKAAYSDKDLAPIQEWLKDAR